MTENLLTTHYSNQRSIFHQIQCGLNVVIHHLGDYGNLESLVLHCSYNRVQEVGQYFRDLENRVQLTLMSSVLAFRNPYIIVDGDSNLVTLLQSIQEQLTNLDITISNLEKGQPKIKPYQGDHQLHYINQSVDSLTSRLEQLLQLDTQKPQVTYNTHLNKFSKVYACKFCPLQFSKACSLGGHISRTHKEQSLQQKLLIKKITKKRKQQI